MNLSSDPSAVTLSTAPGRCGICGNPTDIYGGAVLSITTQERATCRASPATHLTLATSEDEQVIRDKSELAASGNTLDLPKAVLRHLGIRPESAPWRIEAKTEIPMQAGLAGSTALVVAILGAVWRRLGVAAHPWRIAEEARRIEADALGVFCGLQDQHMAAFGGLNFMDFAGKDRLRLSRNEPLATVEPLAPYSEGVPLLAAHTGVRHQSGVVHASPRQRWQEGWPTYVSSYRRISSLARMAKRALLDRDWPLLGSLMNENHEIVRELGGSGPENDRLIDSARRAGAWGAKLAGAGGGGTILVLTPDLEAMSRAMTEAGADRLLYPKPSPGLIVKEDAA